MNDIRKNLIEQMLFIESTDEFIRVATTLRGLNKPALGVDFGLTKIGLSISDCSFIISSPLETYKRAGKSRDTQYVCKTIIKHNACLLIIGLPINSHNKVEHDLYKEIINFFKETYALLSQCGHELPPIYMQDERFSTQLSLKLLDSLGFNKRQSQSLNDKIAAAYIMQSALDLLHKE